MSRPREPLISVLLPVRNAESTLPATLRSLLRQTEPRFEAIVVDDGSRDGTAGLTRRFADEDTRIRVLGQGPAGLIAALNVGLQQCRAPFVARMDADDLMHRERLAVQLQALESSPALAGLGCRVRLFPRQGLAEGMRRYEHWLNAIQTPQQVRQEAYVECPIAHPTLFMRTHVLRELGYRDMDWPEDYDLLLRLLARGHELGSVPRRLLSWRDGPERLSRRSPRYSQERFVACKAAFLAEHFLAKSERYTLWGYGGTGRGLRKALLEHGKCPARVVELHPGRLGNRIHGAAVIPPEALAASPRDPIVVSVAGQGPRTEIRASLRSMGYEEGTHFVCAA